MIDRFSQTRLKRLYPGFGDKVLELMNEISLVTGKQLSIKEGIRSLKKQHSLYKQSLTELGPYQSPHNYGLAADLCFNDDDFMLRQMDEFERESTFGEIKHLAKQKGLYCHIEHDIMVIHLEMSICKLKELEEAHRRDGLHGVWEMLDRSRNVPYGSGWIGDYKFYQCIELEGV